jgi:hypothetical protein
MPAGTESSFAYFQLSSSQETAMGLIDTNSYTAPAPCPLLRPLEALPG